VCAQGGESRLSPCRRTGTARPAPGASRLKESTTGEEEAKGILERIDQAVKAALDGVTLKDLAPLKKIRPEVDKGGSVDI
jgi:hypothetical protein